LWRVEQASNRIHFFRDATLRHRSAPHFTALMSTRPPLLPKAETMERPVGGEMPSPSGKPAPTGPPPLEQALRLVWITDERLSADQTIDIAKAALVAGARAIQLRRYDLTAAEQFVIADKLRRITQDHRALLLVNDRVDIALAVGADGIHLGSRGLPPERVRRFLDSHMVVGYSAHNEADVAHAAIRGADYCSISPIFETISKPLQRQPLGEEGLRRAAARSVLPLVALGGINDKNAHLCVRAGAIGVSVSGALGGSDNPAELALTIARAVGLVKK